MKVIGLLQSLMLIRYVWHNINTKGDFHWRGRACKIYTKMPDDNWKLIAHTGLLDYGNKPI